MNADKILEKYENCLYFQKVLPDQADFWRTRAFALKVQLRKMGVDLSEPIVFKLISPKGEHVASTWSPSNAYALATGLGLNIGWPQ